MTRHSNQPQSRVIELNQLTALDEFPAYVAIYSTQASLDTFSLSPVVMQWSEQIQLCKVNECESFWCAQQGRQSCNLQELFDPILISAYGDEYIAVFANHPWRCLLYLNYQIQQRSQGIYFLHGLLNQNIFKTLGWKYWFEVQDDLIEHLLVSQVKRFKPEAFRARQSQLKRFIHRMGVVNPFVMLQVESNAMKRRFDYWLGQIWKWTFSTTDDLLEFPWVALIQQSIPSVSRDMEYPVNQWVFIEQLLREDFETICDQFNWDKNEHINRMVWNIRLFNEQIISVELSFRFPYSLHRERPEFNTALYQARYVYESLIQKLRARDQDLDLPETMPFLSWKIDITERLQLPAIIWDLFADELSEFNVQNIYELQNKLPVPIECYRGEASFFPELSFSRQSIGVDMKSDIDDYQWQISASQRPLFYYITDCEIDRPEILPGHFLERCSTQWWLEENLLARNRDYYVLKNQQGRASWVYRDFDGKWFKQGEFC